MRAPEGFVLEHEGREILICRHECLADLRRAGLTKPRPWEELLSAGPAGSGRGRIARIEVSPGRRLVLKRMRRGGLLRLLWRDRFPGERRLLANLTTPIEAQRRGIATPDPMAMLLQSGPPGCYRAWMAAEEIEDAVDLRARFSTSPLLAETEMSAVLACLRRMHDAGIEHRDLNLGNLLIRSVERAPQVFVVDLDRAILRDGPVSFARRQRALRRLERSWVKTLGDRGPAGAPDVSSWYRWYAGGDPEIARRLEAGRTAGRAWLALHRVGWTRRP